MATGAIMTEQGIFRTIIFFTIPLILGNLLQQLYSTVDTIIIGNFASSTALAAIGSSTTLIYLFIAFSQGAAIGAGVLIAQFFGAGNRHKLRLAVHTAFLLAVIVGLILTIGGVVLTRPLLFYMNTPSDVMAEASTYFSLYSLGLIFSVVYNMAAGILNAVGDSKTPLKYLGIAAVINILLDLVLVVSLNFGIADAAIATDISQLVSAAFTMRFLVRINADYQIILNQVALDKAMVIDMIKIGLPTGIQNMVISLSNIMVQASVNNFGAAAIAGFGVYLKVDGFNVLPVMSLGLAIMTFVGQNYGAGKLVRARQGLRVTIILSIIYTGVTGALLLFGAEPVMKLFSDDAAVIYFGVLAMNYFCPFYWLLGVLQATAGALRGTGRTAMPMAILLLALCAFRAIWIVFILPQFMSIEGIYAVYPVSWFIGSVLMLMYAAKSRLLF